MKRTIFSTARFLSILLIMATLAPAAAAKSGGSAYQTGFISWRAADNGFAGWTLNGVQINTNHELEFQQTSASAGTDPYAPGTYNGGNYYNGGSFLVGEATSPVIPTPFNYKEAIASWNASTPAGSWIEVQFRAQYGATWTKWYTLGIWASDTSTIARHSVNGQSDTDGTVYTDTFVSLSKKLTTNVFQLKLRLFSADGTAVATIRNASVAYSLSAPSSATASAGNPALWNTFINVPECSQMVYLDGGEVWCSPTSTSMVLGYWNNDTGPCEPRVRAAVSGVYDWIYDGHGNWPFNTAYTATQGYEAYVARFTSLERAEEYVAAGVPVVMSVAWGKKDLTNASVSSTAGHLLVLVGFDRTGNPIINDPAAASDAEVTRTYLRSEFEPLWLTRSGGAVYLIYPQGKSVPSVP
jgi:hypothetical protein